MAGSRQGIPSWLSAAAATRVDFDGGETVPPKQERRGSNAAASGGGSDADLGFAERALSAAGAAIVSAVLVNPLDIAKVRRRIISYLALLGSILAVQQNVLGHSEMGILLASLCYSFLLCYGVSESKMPNFFVSDSTCV